MPAAPEPLSEARAAELREVIARLTFVFAKTLAWMPHEYVVRTADNQATYGELVAAIRRHGIPGQFRGRRYKYLYPGDGWRYWWMGPKYPLINRAKLSDISTTPIL
jgi:hypothetical protein